MTALQNWCQTFRDWLNRDDTDYPDTLVTTFIRMAEAALSDQLRCADQILISTAPIAVDRVLLPPDWRELDFVRIVDGYPLEYIERTAFYAKSPAAQLRYYSITGNYMLVGGPPTPTAQRNVELSYYGSVPPLSDPETWVQTKYPNLFLPAVMVSASAYGVEDQRAQGFQSRMQAIVDDINQKHLSSKASGSNLRRNIARGYV